MYQSYPPASCTSETYSYNGLVTSTRLPSPLSLFHRNCSRLCPFPTVPSAVRAGDGRKIICFRRDPTSPFYNFHTAVYLSSENFPPPVVFLHLTPSAPCVLKWPYFRPSLLLYVLGILYYFGGPSAPKRARLDYISSSKRCLFLYIVLVSQLSIYNACSLSRCWPSHLGS